MVHLYEILCECAVAATLNSQLYSRNCISKIFFLLFFPDNTSSGHVLRVFVLEIYE